MNILQVLPQMGAGGVERTSVEIVQALHAQGHVPHVAAQSGRLAGELKAAGGILHELPMDTKNPLKLRSNIRALVALIKEQKIDLIHVRSRAPAWAAKPAARKVGVPFITTYHGIYNANSKLKRSYNAIMAKGDIVIANSNFTKAHIIKEHGTDPNKIVVIPRGVAMNIFDPKNISAQNIQDMHALWGVDNEMPILLLPGRLTRWKGQLVAIEALAKLKTKATLILLGDAQGRDQYVEEIKALSKSLNLQKRVIIAPHTNNMPAALMAADLVISASTDPEAFGRIAAEAQAMHKLVVATNHGGATETIISGETGQLVTPSDPEALASGIEDILALTQKQRVDMGKTARKRIGEKFSARALQVATLNVYKKTLKAHNDK